MNDRDERLRQRAYQLWEREGRPHGRAEAHWRQAEAMVTDQNAAESAQPSEAGADEHAAPNAAQRASPEAQKEAQEETAEFYKQGPAPAPAPTAQRRPR